ncbi:response regulator with CheY-like receiver domain and winged-helix DNA-binding domain [Synechococcus sp. PCC 7502]|uniref:response regulator n=1 Tax=Synechococcus sp. PCC 7502 TaxID=1173263 RepID=UPI00029FE0DD|nr:response regulator [Synechococcus sp. PCC 7502]AFY74172.1 response regulator with CheY-like receiver domain and winged-helix DNA-binding domain [Synechococcus sp. PCC 7502]
MQKQYQAGELNNLLKYLSDSELSGILRINAQIKSGEKPRSRVLIWRDGKIIYGGAKIPDAQAFAKTLVQKYKPNLADTALRFASRNITDHHSVQELLSQLIKINAFKWQQVKDYACKRIIWTLEQVIPYSGQSSFEPELGNFDLCYEGGSDFDLPQLLGMVDERIPLWNTLIATIPSMEIVPFVCSSNLENIADVSVKKHLEKWVDGKRSLIDIATPIDRDPFQLAQLYCGWWQKDWITFVDPTLVENKQLPVILSVDDSPIIQTMIKRALSSEYEVLLANNAVDALNLLTREGDRISVLILDLTMPDIDGLQLCRTVRSIPKFKNLPVIMLTARDGFIDKVKGQMAGSDRYLTKPFAAEQLLKIIKEYV